MAFSSSKLFLPYIISFITLILFTLRNLCCSADIPMRISHSQSSRCSLLQNPNRYHPAWHPSQGHPQNSVCLICVELGAWKCSTIGIRKSESLPFLKINSSLILTGLSAIIRLHRIFAERKTCYGIYQKRSGKEDSGID